MPAKTVETGWGRHAATGVTWALARIWAGTLTALPVRELHYEAQRLAGMNTTVLIAWKRRQVAAQLQARLAKAGGAPCR